MDASFFTLISFTIFAYLFGKKIWPSCLEGLDSYISAIKTEISLKTDALSEHKALKIFYQEKLQNLHEEIQELQAMAEHKLNFLRVKLDNEMEIQYSYRQKNLRQMIQRIDRQQHKILQNRCINFILAKIQLEIKKNPDFGDRYVLIVLADEYRSEANS